MDGADTLEESLECFVGRGPEFRGGLSNHGPMAVEALAQMGQGEALLPWAARYRERLDVAPPSRFPIGGADWREALGDMRRVGDWTVFFDRELTQAPFLEVARLWVPRLLPGLMAAATHGPIRTFHALRALEQQVTELRVHELAQALGYWAARYQTLPGDPSPVGGQEMETAAGELARLAWAERGQGLIFERMRALEDRPEFSTLVASVTPVADIQGAFSALTRIGARAYLANASHAPIALVHAVTAPAAVRGMLPLLSPSQQRVALAYAWQAVAGLIATNAPAGLSGPGTSQPAGTDEELINQTVVSGDEHAIKLTEAALRENALTPDSAYLLAAADAGVRLAPA
ncbi:MAG TPA: questin oxidase family protein [Candidatus Dormibacteraeota bacterium]|nr:questin oxidase family protein [Candidatus Dormibacteraeota bacterium]